MIPGPLLIRADANIAMGAGHVMRCLALAHAWQDAGGRAVIVMAGAAAAIEERLRAESCELVCISAQAGTEEDCRETIRLAQEQNADWVVVDGYQFESDYQRLLKAAGLKVLFVDDYGPARRYSADVVLNQNVGADEALYQSREPYTRLLLGPRYCMLRLEFAAWRDWKRDIPKVGGRVLVTMGGSDPENVTGRVIQALSLVKHERLAAMVVLGGSNPHFEALQSAAGQKGITLRTNVSNMAKLMAEADVAISAAGSTCWELCLLGLPALLIDVAENQKAVARELDRLGCAIHLGDLESASATRIANQLERLLESQDLRRSLSQRSRELVDGGGARRVASILRGNCGLRIRPARQDDARMLWEWANDPEVRAASFSQEFIPWETHVAWFTRKLRDQQCFIFVGENEEGKSVGQIRFDPTPDGDFEIGISVAKASRGRGLASPLIELGVETVNSKVGEKRIHAFVRANNQASINAFEKAGFRRVGDTDVRGNAALHLISERA
jgi:UDP-2,4-diacetamido-2,4,6-trideoxy-beta-L-altropyranose hydrolase